MSKQYPDLDLTNFPDEIDNRRLLQDPSTDEDLAAITLFLDAISRNDMVEANQILNNNPQIKDMQITAESINRHEDMIIAMERLFTNDIEGYIEQVKEATTPELIALANEAKDAAVEALQKADEAVSAANTAVTIAGNAKTAAENALTSASNANTKAESAITTANTANQKAESAITQATGANSTANTALTTANTALEKATGSLYIALSTTISVPTSITWDFSPTRAQYYEDFAISGVKTGDILSVYAFETGFNFPLLGCIVIGENTVRVMMANKPTITGTIYLKALRGKA